MKPIRRSLIPALAIAALASSALSQTDVLPTTTLADAPRFTVEALNFASDDSTKSRLDVYVDVGYDVLRFVNEADAYHAGYEVTIWILDSAGHAAGEKTWEETIRTTSYERTVSAKESNLSQKSFSLAPGNYVVKVQVTDDESRKNFVVQRPALLRQFQRNKFGLSDIMLVNTLVYEGEKKVISPNISGDISNLRDGLILFFEAYSRLRIDSTMFVATVRNAKGETALADSFMHNLTGGRTACFHRLMTSNLTAGDYSLSLSAHPRQENPDGSSVEVSASSSHAFVVRWKGVPATITDIDAAITQMMYIMEKDRLEAMKNAPAEKKRELFLEFWRTKDPTPGTERNELMDEYFARVEFANKQFSHFMEGWRSDMGMIYIIFGAPSNVERHPFDSNAKPYEIWMYYELNRQFVFIDQTGFGDYRLQNPIWDVWSTRPR